MGHEVPEAEQSSLDSFFIFSARWWVGDERHIPAALPSGKIWWFGGP